MPIRFGYSADADDAFMSWGLEEGGVDRRGLDWEFVVSDIQTLNEWALEGRLEVTAVSMHAYARVRDRYELLPHGASMGRGYGPVVVAREPLSRGQLQRSEIVVPGGSRPRSSSCASTSAATSPTGSSCSTGSSTRSPRAARRRASCFTRASSLIPPPGS